MQRNDLSQYDAVSVSQKAIKDLKKDIPESAPDDAPIGTTNGASNGSPNGAPNGVPNGATNGATNGLLGIPWRKLSRLLPWFLLLGLALYFFLPLVASLENSVRVLRSMVFWLVALALVAEAFSYVGNGLMLKTFVALGNQKLPLLRGALISLASYSIGLVAGGMVASVPATYRWLNQHGSQREWAAIAGILPSTLITLVLAVISVFGMVQLFISQELTSLQIAGFAVSMLPTLGLAVVLILGSAYRSKVGALVEWIGSRWAKLRKKEFNPAHSRQTLADFYFAWEMLKGGRWQKPLLGAVIYCGLDIAALYFIFLAAGYPVHISILLTGYGLPLLFGRAAFFLPGGVGVIESTMAALYTTLGVPSAESVVVVLAYRVVSFWLPSLAGFPAMMLLQPKKRQSAE